MKTDDFKKYLNYGWEIAQLNEKTIKKVAKDKDATLWGLIFTALAGVATAIGTISLVSMIPLAVACVAWTGIYVGVLWVLSKLFKGKASYEQQFRVQSLPNILYWIGVIPFLGPMLLGVVKIWYLVISIVTVRNVHKLETWQAIVVVMIPVFIAAALLITFLASIAILIASMGLSMQELTPVMQNFG